jgi:hypothetical protein
MMAVLTFMGVERARAQGTTNPAGQQKGLVIYEAFDGDANSDGQVMTLTSSVAYNFNQHFSAGLGIPIYFDHVSSSTSTTGTTSSSGIGNAFAMLQGVWKNPTLNYGTSLTGSAPTGDSKKGLSTGHATFDWNNRLEHDTGRLTPFVDAGLANAVTDTRFFLRPFTSFGKVAHFEAGTEVDLSHSFNLTLSAYDIAPWGTQTVFSRFVNPGSTGNGGKHGRVFEVNHQTTGTASLTRDNGYTVGLGVSPRPYLDLEIGYTRSVHYALNTVSFGAGINLSSFFSRSSTTSIK